MELRLNIQGHFENEGDLRDTIIKRKICYDSEPYYISDKKGGLIQIGFRLTLYGTFPDNVKDVSPDSKEYAEVERDLQSLADVLSSTFGPLHMCGATTAEPSSISYSQERKMRPDVEVHIPIFDQEHFGHPVDDVVRNELHEAIGLLESAGVRKTRWKD
jgi:hypothetical protein